jgi:hypothetical protein
MTLTMSTTHVARVRAGTPTDPHAHHRREALALHRSGRRTRRRAHLAKLRSALRSVTAPFESSVRVPDAEPFAAGSGGRVDL